MKAAIVTPIKTAVRSEDVPAYAPADPSCKAQTTRDDSIIAEAMGILLSRLGRPGLPLSNPGETQDYLRLRIAALGHEVFGALMLDNRHCVISDEQIFRGTIDSCAVYPREVVKLALACNAAAVILYHNHPSGIPEPSRADEHLTQRLKEALALVDVRVLDHIVVGHGACVSFAERGLV